MMNILDYFGYLNNIAVWSVVAVFAAAGLISCSSRPYQRLHQDQETPVIGWDVPTKSAGKMDR